MKRIIKGIHYQLKDIQNSIGWPGLFAILSIFLLYLPLVEKHFEQDEWHTFGWVLYNIHEFGVWFMVKIALRHSIPLMVLFNIVDYLVFGVNNFVPVIIVLFLIVSSSALWIHIIYKITSNRLIAVLSIIFGYTSFISMQSVTWVIPAIANQGSFFFLTLTLLMFWSYLQAPSVLKLFFSLFLMTCSISMKFSTYFLFLLLPLMYALYRNTRTFAKKDERIAQTTAVVIGVLGILLLIYKLQGHTRIYENRSQFIVNAFYLPTKGVGQILIAHPDIVYRIADSVATKRYEHLAQNSILSYGLVAEHISVIFGLVFIIFGVGGYAFVESKMRKFLLLAIVLYVTSYAPYILDKFSTGTAYLESRYYFYPVIGLGMIVCVYFVSLLNILKKRDLLFRVFGFAIFASVSIVYFGINLYLIVTKNSAYIQTTKKRLEFVNEISNSVIPRDAQSFILYTPFINHPNTGNARLVGFQFQTGVLYPVLVTLHEQGRVTHRFFQDDTAFNPYFSGVLERDGQIVGWFSTLDELFLHMTNHPEHMGILYGVTFDYALLPESSGWVDDMRFASIRNSTEQIRNLLSERLATVSASIQQ